MRILLLLLAISASACGRRDRPEPPTAEESVRLNDAENMLNDLANETGPENAEAPSDPEIRSDNQSGQ